MASASLGLEVMQFDANYLWSRLQVGDDEVRAFHSIFWGCAWVMVSIGDPDQLHWDEFASPSKVETRLSKMRKSVCHTPYSWHKVVKRLESS